MLQVLAHVHVLTTVKLFIVHSCQYLVYSLPFKVAQIKMLHNHDNWAVHELQFFYSNTSYIHAFVCLYELRIIKYDPEISQNNFNKIYKNIFCCYTNTLSTGTDILSLFEIF